jgi:hypothetical protein
MQVDRTTKTLLFFIAVGLWGILLKSCFEPAPSIAQNVGLTTPVRIVGVDGGPLPVAIIKQSSPLEVRTPNGTRLRVDTDK